MGLLYTVTAKQEQHLYKNIRFAKYVERLQKQIQEDLDREFKMFLKWRGIEIEAGNFFLEFNKPMNFSSYRDLQIETERANLLNNVMQVPFLSNQFKLKKYLGSHRRRNQRKRGDVAQGK